MSELRIIFHRPPEVLRVGGLDLAMNEMAAALRVQGVQVLLADELNGALPAFEGRTVGWFHGLWQPAYRRLAAAYRSAQIPYVVSPHGMLEPWAMRHKAWKKIPYFYLLERRWLSRAAVVFSTGALESASVARWLPRVSVAEVPLGLATEKVPDYLAARRQLGWADDERVLLYLSRVHPKKGLLELVRGLAELPRERLEPVRLVIVGDGPAEYMAEVRAFIEQHQDRLPRIDEVGPLWGDVKWAFLQGADLFCLPTYSENFGLAVLESLRVGTPVLTTDQTPWGSFADRPGFYISEPGQAGVSAGVRDALTRYQWTARNRAQLADWAKEAFDWQGIAQRYVAVLDEAK